MTRSRPAKGATDTFSHLDEQGQVRMVDVSGKPGTLRTARAEALVRLRPATVQAITGGDIPKGNVLTTAKLAGIQAAKDTPRLIPLCHPLALTWVDVAIEPDDQGLRITSIVKARESTGPEMEALTAAATAALTVYDMCKAVDDGMSITGLRLLEKSGGKSQPVAVDSAHGSDYRPRTAVIVLSDAVAAGKRENASGDILKAGFEDAGCRVESVTVLPDEPAQLVAAVRSHLAAGVELLITSGGTGLGPRDHTVAALGPLLEGRLPGVEQALHAYGRGRVRTAMLGRHLAGTIDKAIVVSIPGSPAAAADALHVLVPTLFHAFHILKGGGHGD